MRFGSGFVLGAALFGYATLLVAGSSGVTNLLPQALRTLSLESALGTLAFFVATITAYATWMSSQAAKSQSEVIAAQLEVSRAQAQAAMLPKRLEIYEVVRDYLIVWAQYGHPKTDKLPSLVRAWETAQFLFDREVVSFIREVWIDSLNADLNYRVSLGEADGDRSEAFKRHTELFLKYFGTDNNEDAAHVAAFKGMRLDYWKNTDMSKAGVKEYEQS
jgi:hypothetical protein